MRVCALCLLLCVLCRTQGAVAEPYTNLTGLVTFQREGLPFVFAVDDEGTYWRVARADGSAPGVAVGGRIRAEGTREPSVKHRLLARRLDALPPPDPSGVPPPREAAIADIFAAVLPYGDSAWYGQTLVTEGLLRDINRRQTTTQLLVGEGEWNLQVEMPQPIEAALPADLVLGATVRVTGALAYTSIENYASGEFGRVENVELLPLGPGAVEVVRRAPFWTVGRLTTLFAWVILLLAVVFAWAITLRRMVARRTRELGESLRLRARAQIEADAARRERLRLAADLHDGFQQYLAGAVFRLKAALNYLPPDAAESRAQLEKVRTALQHTQSGLRSTLWAMNEESEGPESLMELFRFVARRMAHWDGVVEIASEGAERQVARALAGTLLLILQEAVGNAIRHGAARRVRVKVVFGEERLTLTVADDGTGFDPAAHPAAGHFGLAGMRRRAADLGGTMTLDSRPGAGATVAFSIPYA